jgi:hypothetical protein
VVAHYYFDLRASKTPEFELGQTSVFLDFIDGASALLKTCLEALHRAAEEDILGDKIKDQFTEGSISLEEPLHSTMTVMEIMATINEAAKTCEASKIEEVLDAQRIFADWIASHEIHLILGGLRLPEKSNHFIFSLCEMDFDSWVDFAADSTLFGMIFKAVWLRCIRGTECCDIAGNGDEDLKKLRLEILAPGVSGEEVKSFKDFFIETHYKPVRVYKTYFNL